MQRGVMIVMLLAAVWLASEPGFAGNMQGRNLESRIADLPLENLSQAEHEGLVYMYQEEQLARDVYRALAGAFDLPVFANIADSEQQHMDSIRMLLERYSIPVPEVQAGIYQYPALQELYVELTASGMESALAALHVGATIEDLDILDLRVHLDETDNRDIALVYQNLMKGSRNHMRSFGGLLLEQGQPYQAQFLDQEEVDAIIGSERERGMLDEHGQPL